MMTEDILMSTDKSALNLEFIHDYLCNSAYWSKGRSKEEVKTSIDNSLCFGMYTRTPRKQIGFARVTTDYVVFAWVMDVFIDEEFQGRGFGKRMIDYILNYPSLQAVKGFGLRTSDAHGLYKQFGFTEIPNPETWMFKNNSK